jgi:hypothetical protein
MPLEVEKIKKMKVEECYSGRGSVVDLAVVKFLKQRFTEAFTASEVYLMLEQAGELQSIRGHYGNETVSTTKNRLSTRLFALSKKRVIQKKGAYYWYEKEDDRNGKRKTSKA